MKLRRIIATVTAVAVASTGLAACSSSDGEGKDQKIVVGTTDAAKKAWTAFEEVAEDNGFNIEVENFEDYATPNVALAQSQNDINNFQTLRFLAEYNVGNDEDLVPIVSTEIVPLALFWKDHDSLDGIEGETVAIPNDPSNQGRALNVLASAGLVELTGEDSLSPTPADVDEAKSKVKVTTVDAAQTTSAWGEGTPAVINNSFLERAGIDPTTAVAQDDPASDEAAPYINAFVVRAEDKDNEVYRELAQLWHDPKVQAAVDEDSQGTSVQVQRSPEEMDKVLQRVMDELEAE
ncbi:MetQ/NlpA family ABC transporter substrate-binding protein [Corynebacterium confusum]|uniref:MetQ/NlpA family ABC transporter substrate-binding protein n=1 Tax=Corynebacterium confusum TaxID=71254 RepID=UPI0025B5C302|nr:MetQ/NlpA family ABC transporter substrate-binding protein [Corynebacterium confusum]WJY88813.1 D-methionine-binding lipoprotein MetQ precursor [Corynebacterium confusum]